ncbi:hypothetical protein Tco_1050885 [Tanacetum coccineum]
MLYDLPLPGGHTPGSDKGSKKLNELTKLCTKLFDKVTSLEEDLKETKKVYGKALTKLVKKVKHLEDKLKSTTARRKARLVISDADDDLDDDLQRMSIIEEIDLAKILADASRERVKTYTRRRSTNNSRDSTAGGLFSTAEEVQDTIKRYQTLKKKPVSVAQARKNMMIYLKNMVGYKMDYFKGMSYDEIRPTFEVEYKNVHTLFKKDTKVEKTKTKRIAEETLLQESFKKLRTAKASSSKGNMKKWKIIRVGNHTELYQVFEDMLENFDREDLEKLWSLVNEKFSTTEPTDDKEKAL